MFKAFPLPNIHISLFLFFHSSQFFNFTLTFRMIQPF